MSRLRKYKGFRILYSTLHLIWAYIQKLYKKFIEVIFLPYRIIRYRTAYFFDTNFIVLNTSEINDARLTKLRTISRKYFITESVDTESSGMLSSGKYSKRLKSPTQTVGFYDLYHKDLSICPVYYNFLGSIHNPASIFSDSFFAELLAAKIALGGKSQELIRLNNKTMDLIAKSLRSDTHLYHGPKPDLLKKLDAIKLTGLKKKRKAMRRKNVNYFNDMRSLSLSLVYALLHKENVKFVTADQDFVYFFFELLHAISQQIVFNEIALNTLGKEGVKKVFLGSKEAIFISKNLLMNKIENFMNGLFYGYRGFNSSKFSIYYWDQAEQRYYQFSFVINKAVRQLFLHAHGSLECYFSKNNEFGAFIAYRYWWPPSTVHNKNFVKILPLRKNIINWESKKVPSIVHENLCKYRRLDRQNDTRNFLGFKTNINL